MSPRRRLSLVFLAATVIAVGGSCSAILGLDDKGLAADAGVDAPREHLDAGTDVHARADTGVDAPLAPHDSGNDTRRVPTDAGIDAVARDAGIDAVARDAGRDARGDAAPKDAARDHGMTEEKDAGKDAGSDAPLCIPDDAGYNDMSQPECWNSFPDPEDDQDAEYTGAAFDGRYAYFITDMGTVVQYDTTSSVPAWVLYQKLPSGGSWAGLVFDGRYLYCVPQGVPFTRYDTLVPDGGPNPILDNGRWTSTSNDAATSTTTYAGGTFDGTYVYFAPVDDGNGNPSGLVTRFNTLMGFDDTGAWSTFDTTTLPGSPGGFMGAVYDGKHVYLMPGNNGTAGLPVVRVPADPASFGVASDWLSVDLSTVSEAFPGVSTGAFDGRYVYPIPSAGGEVALRYDTQAPFGGDAGGSWMQSNPFPASTSGYSINVGAFDGRYVYLVPSVDPSLLRIDTTKAFGASGTLSLYDTAHIGAAGFFAAVFDGQYLYLAPSGLTNYDSFARFKARATPMQALPGNDHFYGSFY